MDRMIELLAGIVYAAMLVLGMPAVLYIWMAVLMR